MSEAIEKIMEQAQVFASTWSLVGRSAFGSTIEEANEEKAKLEAMLREVITCALDQSSMLLAALEDAHRLGFWCAAIWADRDDLIAGTGSPAYIQDRATDLAALAGTAPVPQEYAELPDFDAMAIARYRVVPAHDSMFYQHAVVAGDGSQQLFIGREVECQNMARKFAGAFLDGVFVAAPAQPDTEVEQLRREIAGLRAALAPFANYEKMRSTIGGAAPKAGVIWGCESKYGIAEITAEDMRAAIAALAGTAPVPQEYAELPNFDELERVIYPHPPTSGAADSVLEDAAPFSPEREHAIRQGHEIAASDGYFDARPQIESKDRRKVFQAGFERGWDAARKQGANHA